MTEREIQIAKCKKIIMAGGIILGVGFLFMIIFGALGLDISGFGFLIILVGLITGGLGFYDKVRSERSFCAACGKKYDYEDDVSWEVVEEYNSDGSSTSRLIDKVEITCSCANCGNESSFTKNFTVSTLDSRGKLTQKNLETEIRKYFIQKNE